MKRLWFIGFMILVAFASAVATLAVVKPGMSDEVLQNDDLNNQIIGSEMYENTTPAVTSSTDKSFFKSLLTTATTFFCKIIDLPIEKLLRLFLKKVQENLQEKEPITLKVNETIDIASKDLICDINITEANAKNPSTFETRNIESDFSKRSINLEFFYPEFLLDTIRYTLKGSVLGHRLRGSGNITANTKKMILSSTARYELRGMKLYINYLEIHYSFKKLAATITGLEVPFVTSRQLNQILSERMAYYLRRNEKKVSRKISEKARKYINEKIQSFGIIDILKLIWSSLTSSKPATKKEKRDFNTYSSMLDESFQVHRI